MGARGSPGKLVTWGHGYICHVTTALEQASILGKSDGGGIHRTAAFFETESWEGKFTLYKNKYLKTRSSAPTTTRGLNKKYV